MFQEVVWYPASTSPPGFRQPVAALPGYVLVSWRARYLIAEGMELQARGILAQQAAAVRALGEEPNAQAVWLRLMDRVVRQGGAPPELLAASALAGLATGLRPQGFEKPV